MVNETNKKFTFQGKINDDYVIFLLTDGMAASECRTGSVAATAAAVDDNPNPVPEWLSHKSWKLIQRASILSGLVFTYTDTHRHTQFDMCTYLKRTENETKRW